MKSGSFSMVAGSVILVMASMTQGADTAVPVQPSGDKSVVVTPAAPAEGAVNDRQAKISAEMREISKKLRPAYERIQNDVEMKAAIDNMMKAQMAVGTMRDKKLRADPDAAILIERLDALRKELKEITGAVGAGQGMGPLINRAGPMGGAVRAMPAPNTAKPVVPVVAPKTP